MLNENAKKWVQALRSGEYKQGKDALRDNDKFCCLGVACEVYKKENPDFIYHSFDWAIIYLTNQPS